MVDYSCLFAIVKFNDFASISGSINGKTYSRTRAGNVIKSRSNPVNPNTSFQSAVRAQFAALSATWRGLTDGQRKSWDAAGETFPAINAIGESYTPSGFQLYMNLNGNLQAVDAAIISVPPSAAAFVASSIDTFQVVNTAGVTTEASIDLSTPVGADNKMLVELTGSLSAGVNSPGTGAFRKTFVSALNADAIDVFAEYVVRFGSASVGSKVFVKIFNVNTVTGQRLSIGTQSAIVSGT